MITKWMKLKEKLSLSIPHNLQLKWKWTLERHAKILLDWKLCTPLPSFFSLRECFHLPLVVQSKSDQRICFKSFKKPWLKAKTMDPEKNQPHPPGMPPPGFIPQSMPANNISGPKPPMMPPPGLAPPPGMLSLCLFYWYCIYCRRFSSI